MRVWKGMLLLVLLCMLACVSAQAEGVQIETCEITPEGFARITWTAPEGTAGYVVTAHYCQTEEGPYTEVERSEAAETECLMLSVPGSLMLYTVTSLADGTYDTRKILAEEEKSTLFPLSGSVRVSLSDRFGEEEAELLAVSDLEKAVLDDREDTEVWLDAAWEAEGEAYVLLVLEAPNGYRVPLSDNEEKDMAGIAERMPLSGALDLILAYTGEIPEGEYGLKVYLNGHLAMDTAAFSAAAD